MKRNGVYMKSNSVPAAGVIADTLPLLRALAALAVGGAAAAFFPFAFVVVEGVEVED